MDKSVSVECKQRCGMNSNQRMTDGLTQILSRSLDRLPRIRVRVSYQLSYHRGNNLARLAGWR